MSGAERSTAGRLIDHIEETFIATVMGLMTLITFANVVARYIFNANILWALEVTVFLFAWLVLIGMSYCVKKSAHLGVDVVLAMLSPPMRRMFGLLASAACLAFCFLLLKGAWDYWLPFATTRAWYETDDIFMPAFLQFLADWMNEGEAYEKLPRFIPYFALPLGMTLLTLRFLQAAWRIFIGRQDTLIASHEVDEMIEEFTEAKKEN